MRKQLIIGMPSSGKSTFIAALRHLLVANEVDTALELTGLSDEERHVNALETEWLACREVERTKPASEGWVEFRVRNRTTAAEAVLSIPDLRGETFEQPLCAGRCVRSLYEFAGAADALLLFTSANRPDDDGLITDLNDMDEEHGDLPPPKRTRGKAPKLTPFNPDDMREEAKTVEFLQMINRRPMHSRRRKIGVIISAWDVVPAGTTPANWFEGRRPMLEQFLSTNADLWEVRVYGVSALGGKLPRDKRKLARKSKPSERIIVVGPGALAHDLTSPLSWLGAA